MYSETYPLLNEKLDFENFEQIASVFDKHFPSLFNLKIWENHLQNNSSKNSYIDFLSLFTSKLQGLFTPEEIVPKIYDLLLSDEEVRACFLETMLFVPGMGDNPSSQLAFLEKTATGEIKPAEPVTFLDMLRVTYNIQKKPVRNKIAVLNLDSMQPAKAVHLKQNNTALMVNFNRDVKGTAKWGVVDLREANPQVYCETPLLEAEKKELEEKLQCHFTEVSPGKADSLLSTGYTAIAWLDQNITKFWNSDTNSDFNALLSDYTLMQFRGDSKVEGPDKGIAYQFKHNERNTFVTPELEYIIRYHDDDRNNWPGYALIKLSSFAMLGAIEEESVAANDLAKVIEIVGRKTLTSDAFLKYTAAAYRSNIPRFSHTLGEFGNPKILKENDERLQLIVPEHISQYDLFETHKNSCKATKTNNALYKFIKRDCGQFDTVNYNLPPEDIASAMILTIFRARAKKREIAIELPNEYQLLKNEHNFIVDLMENNAYVTEFTPNNNESLQALKKKLLPVFARNRWLKDSGYLPPMVDNYWQRAAKYWLRHLSLQTTLLDAKDEHIPFKRCVSEMGLKGLHALLTFLRDEEQREYVDGLFGKNKPAFYAACQAHEVAPYLDMLLEHVGTRAPFPFSELGVAYHSDYNDKYIELLAHVNVSEQFERVVLADSLKNPAAFGDFLLELTQQAADRQWLGLIIVPELEDKNAVSDMHRHLRAIYDNLNNVILRNRHLKLAETVVANIKAVSNFADDAAPGEAGPRAAHGPVIDTISIDDVFYNMARNHHGKTWPLKRGGVVQLQLQQQQQIQQNRQIQQEQQKIHLQAHEEAIAGERVTYDNIDALLTTYYNKFALENPVDPKYASLKQGSESLLQGFFRTWINASPNVNAPYIIRSMTLDAAKMLIRNQARFTSGVSLDNLPKSFYTQRAKDGSLILCYNPEIGYSHGVNPFTVNLSVKTPKAHAWEGDFRLFDDKYIHQPINELEADDLQYIKLFALLQPPRNYEADYQAFCQTNPQAAQLIAGSEQHVKNYWLIFLQMWKVEGNAGILKFLQIPVHGLSLTPAQMNDLLFRKQSQQIRDWLADINFTLPQLQALGQVYYHYGHDVMTLLLLKFKQIHTVLGGDFFDRFNHTILSRSENYDCFINVRFFEAMDDMIEKLKAHKADAARSAWLAISFHHMQTVPWEPVETLWRAYEYFLKEITDLGLELVGDEFDSIKSENMLVCMDRILETLKRLAGQDEKVRFLQTLSKMQLTHGGVHYAIQQEGLKYFDDELQLWDFRFGTPTYAPNLQNLYSWGGASDINMLRTLASRSQFGHQDYQYLAQQLGEATERHKDQLLWLLYTQYDNRNVGLELEKISKLDPRFVSLIARTLHDIAYKQGNQTVQVSLEALIALFKKVDSDDALFQKIIDLSSQYPHGTLLEAITILWKTNAWDSGFSKLITLLEAPILKSEDCPDFLFRDAYKLSVLFGKWHADDLTQLHTAMSHLSPIVHNELRLLIDQVLSIDYETSALDNLQDPQNWDDLLQCITQMQANRAQTAEHRIAYIDKLLTRELQFKYSKSGEFRALQNSADDRPDGMSFFVDHHARLWIFMLEHIAVPSNGNTKEALQPIVLFFKRLQMNRTYLNEIEPLLATLEKTKKGERWSASYFYQMLKALQPEDQQASFPISLIKVVLNDVTLGSKPIDSLEKNFPELLITPLQAILKNTIFSKDQQSVLCELALKEFGWQKSNTKLGEIINLLTPEERAGSRDYALGIFASSKNLADLENRIEKTTWLLGHDSHHDVVRNNWTKTTALWLKAVSAKQSEDELFTKIRQLHDVTDDKQALILHIIAWSSLTPGLRDAQTYDYELHKGAPKLLHRLMTMTEYELELVAKCYPNQPSPGVDDLLRLLKKQSNSKLPLDACLGEFLRSPHPEPRMDYQIVAKMREADLERMLTETRITRGKDKVAMDARDTARVSLIFAELKQLQAGKIPIYGYDKPVEKMTREELAHAFSQLSSRAAIEPENDQLRAQIWAILFQGLSLTTRKYPHLAQQFALIANDICVDTDTRVLRLATGEGKSHFVALRALRHAGMGKVVDVCTAKRTLAERDLEDYQAFFNFFNVSSAYIHPLSSHDTYKNAQIHYTTTGDLSLFIDEQSFNGHPINIPPHDRVGLFDEFDFIRFEEGRKTEYNYARPTGRTPKQMTWFYQAINKFYLDNRDNIIDAHDSEINIDALRAAAITLQTIAGEDEEKQNLVNSLLRDPLQLVRWLQSAHEAHTLTFGIGFTIREENIHVGDTRYPMREIIPLSSDNQKMAGSTFSAGVQQLLAVRLNTEARIKNQPQNFHIHPESNIISSQVASQRMKQLWGRWEGFSGTISASQAETLHEQHGTEVLHVSTNQFDLRTWHNAGFYEKEDNRFTALVQQIRRCLKEKKSMLFSCKNDAQVVDLKAKLQRVLSEEEFANFIFYTNEDELSASEVLSKKQSLEKWQGGQKQQAIGLIASGFGRGDNVGVEAVFLFDVNDINDLLQKGGRTARNGEEGEVFQFYLTKELLNEQKRLLKVLKHTPGVNVQSIKDILAQVEGNNEGEKTFERVMLLREYVFSLQNAANQGYHEGLAQFSTWGMTLISLFEDPAQASEFVNSITFAIKHLDKIWIDVSSSAQLTSDDKIKAIEAAIEHEAARLKETCKDVLKQFEDEVNAFHLTPHPQIKLEMVLETHSPTTSLTKDVASVCIILAGLPVTDKEESLQKQIPELIGELAHDDMALELFSRQIQTCQSLTQFFSILNFSVQKLRNPSKGFKAAQDSVIKKIEADELFEGVPSSIAEPFFTALHRFNSEITEEIIISLSKPSLLSNVERIQAALPVLEYMTRFSERQQHLWGLDYAKNLDKLINGDSQKRARLFSGDAMSYRHASSLWQLAAGHSVETGSSPSLEVLQKAIKKAPEQRFRILGRAEVLASFLSPEKAAEFINNFSLVMEQFTEGKDWDIFVKLVEKTKNSWNKSRDSANREVLTTLWSRLAANAPYLPELSDVLSESMRLNGSKKWFESLLPIMTLPAEITVKDPTLFQDILTGLNNAQFSKDDKILITHQLAKALPNRNVLFSLAYFFSILNLTPTKELLSELLSFELELPTNLPFEVADIRNHLNYRALSYLNDTGFYSRMSLLEREHCFTALNRLSCSVTDVFDENMLDEKITAILEKYKRFLEALAKEADENTKPLLFVKGAAWYLEFIANNPNAVLPLDKLTQSLPRRLFIETIINEFGLHSFTNVESKTLLRLAYKKRFTDLEFSKCCQNLSAFKKLLTQISSFSTKDKELLHGKLMVIPADLLMSINTLIIEYQKDIKANPAIIDIILSYSLGALPLDRLLHISRFLLQTAGHQTIAKERISNLKLGIDHLVSNYIEEPSFSDALQQLAYFDNLLVSIGSIGDEEKSLLQKNLLNLPVDRFLLMLKEISKYGDEIRANPQVLLHLTNYALSNDIDDDQLLFLTTELLKAVGKQSCSSARIVDIKQAIDKLIDAGIPSADFYANCQQLVDFDKLLTQINGLDNEVKNSLRKKTLNLELKALSNLLKACERHHKELLANPALLTILVDYAIAGLSQERITFIAAQLAETLGFDACSENRFSNLTVVIDELNNSADSDTQFNVLFQQMLDMERLFNKMLSFKAATKSKLLKDMVGLPKDKLSMLLPLTGKHQVALLANPELIVVLLRYVSSPLIPTTRASFLAELLVTTIGNSPCHKDQITCFTNGLDTLLQMDGGFLGQYDFNANCQYLTNTYRLLNELAHFDVLEKNKLLSRIIDLASDNCVALLEIISSHCTQIKTNPSLLPLLLSYGENTGLSTKEFQLLSSVLIKAVSMKGGDEENIKRIKSGVDRFVPKSENILIRLKDLVDRNPERIEELLFDNVACYLQSYVNDGERNKVKGVIDLFYERAAKERGAPEVMFNLANDKRLEEMFDFNSHNKDRRDQRIIWMHLLNHEAFLTALERGSRHDNQQYQWDIKNNQQLLQLGFNRYIKHCNTVLNNKPKNKVSLNRDLSTSQQEALLQLSDELSIIGNPTLNLNLNEKNVTQMQRSLGKVMSKYESSWFKTKTRKDELSNLQRQMRFLFEEGAEPNRYHSVYNAITAARAAAMSDDNEQNETRFLKLNRGGRSRYLNTLNQMEDMVLRHWAQDVNAFQSFQEYKALSKEDFFAISRKLQDALELNETENEQTFKERRGMKKISHFFTTDKTIDKHGKLFRNLQQFHLNNNPKEIEQDDLTDMLKDIRANLSVLPGHIQTLAKEMLNRGDALANFVGLEKTHSAKSVVHNGRS